MDNKQAEQLLSLWTHYQPHINQLKIHKDRHRNRVVIAGRRFGKTALAINEGLAWLLSSKQPNRIVWIILPEYKQAKSVYWIDPDITKFYMPFVQSGDLMKNDSELYLKNPSTNSWLFLKGADNPSSLRGSGIDVLIWDEVADVKPSAFDIMSPTLADSPNHRQIFIGTPSGYDHFHDLALLGDHDHKIETGGKSITPDPAYQTFHFTSYDNMAWAEGTRERESFVRYIDAERKKYIQMGKLDWFEQEYLAMFRKRAGAVHTLFDRNIHIIPDMELPAEWPRFRGYDFGSTHPTASVKVAIDPDDNWYIERSYKERNRYIEEHARSILFQDNSEAIMGYGDPSGAQWIKEFNMAGLNIRAAKKDSNTKAESWTQLAIDKINEKLYPKEDHVVFLPNGTKIEHAPSFFILGTMENMKLVDELEGLVYLNSNEGINKAAIDETRDPVGHYDLHAALRYFAVSYGFKPSWTSTRPEYKAVSPLHPMPENTQGAVDLTNENVRKQLELNADLEIMRRQGRGW